MLDCGHPLTEDDLREFETQLGVVLPHNYKAFLLRFNGGLPSPDAFMIVGMHRNPYGIIQEFFGIDYPADSSNLDWNYKIFSTDSPTNLFPIASTPSGDGICISISGSDTGAVYLWDYYKAPRDPASYDGVYFLAQTVDDFLRGLFTAPESQR